MYVEPFDCTAEELIGYLDILDIGTELEITNTDESDSVFNIKKIDSFSWIRTDTEESFDSLNIIHRYANNIHSFDMDILCIEIGGNSTTSNSFWPVVNPWSISYGSNGPFKGLTQKEFYATILEAINGYKNDDNHISTKTTTIVLNLHNTVNSTTIIWAISALNDIGYKKLKIRCAEDDYPMIKVSLDVPEEDK